MKTQKDQDTKQAFDAGFLQFFAEGRIFSDVLFFYSLRGFDDTTGRQNRKLGQY